MKQDFQKQILDKLYKDHVLPKKRWCFLAKDSLVWMSAGFVIILGAVAFATVLAIVVMADWDLLDILGESPVSYAFMTVPYAWLVVMVGFIIIADLNIRHTKCGYKISLWKLVGGVVGTSMVLGVVLFSAGIGVAVDRVMVDNIPHYENIANRRMLHLMNPTQGTLTGRVEEKEEEEWKVIDKQQQQWIVLVHEADIIHAALIRVGQPVRILGEIEDDEDYVFEAYDIRPLRPVNAQTIQFRPDHPPVRKEFKERHIKRLRGEAHPSRKLIPANATW